MEQLLYILIFLIFFVSGILFERYIINKHTFSHYDNKPNDFFRSNSEKNNTVEQAHKVYIDDTKIVNKINTANMEPKHSSIGNTKKSKDNTQSAINKLKNMKGM